MKDRFDFEQEIMHCWQITNDIDMLAERCTDEETKKVLGAMSALYNMKFDVMFETFETFIREGKLK